VTWLKKLARLGIEHEPNRPYMLIRKLTSSYPIGFQYNPHVPGARADSIILKTLGQVRRQGFI
jgi:hypothetical protein